jgi:hypothetical protein
MSTENKNDAKGVTKNETTKKDAESTLASSVKPIFAENEELKELLVTSDGQAFYMSNILYAKRHASLNKLKLYKVGRDMAIETFSDKEV